MLLKTLQEDQTFKTRKNSRGISVEKRDIKGMSSIKTHDAFSKPTYNVICCNRLCKISNNENNENNVSLLKIEKAGVLKDPPQVRRTAFNTNLTTGLKILIIYRKVFRTNGNVVYVTVQGVGAETQK